MSLKAQIAACAYVLSAVLLAIAFSFRPGEPLNKPPSIISARAANDVQELTASFTLSFIQTTVDLTYDSPVRQGSAAPVTAKINQVRVFRSNPGYQVSDDIPSPKQLDSLQWPIEVTLRSAGFKFAKSEEVKKLPAGYHLPITVIWAPIADTQGDAGFTLHFNNLNGERTDHSQFEYARSNIDKTISMNVNGKARSFQLNDDIPLPITVDTPGGMPAWLWTDANAAGAVIAFILGSAILLGWFSRLWSWITGQPIPKPTDT